MKTRKYAFTLALLTCAPMALVPQSGCATLYKWERIGMPEQERGDLDVGYLIVDIALIFGYGAGLIALLVDWLTGAIYIPKSHQPWKYGSGAQPTGAVSAPLSGYTVTPPTVTPRNYQPAPQYAPQPYYAPQPQPGYQYAPAPGYAPYYR